jgi:hypothetical protein
MALGIAPLPERQASRRHFVFGPAIGTFEDHYSFTSSDGENLLSEKDFGLCAPAVQAFKPGGPKGRSALDAARQQRALSVCDISGRYHS